VVRAAHQAEPWPALRARRRRWAELLRMIFKLDVEGCRRWGGEMRILAFVTEPAVKQARRAGRRGEVCAARPEGCRARAHGAAARGGRAPLVAPRADGRDAGRLTGARKEIPIRESAAPLP